jgi:hypothetical protein
MKPQKRTSHNKEENMRLVPRFKYKSDINIKLLKIFVSEHLPPGSALRETILRLNEKLDKPSFLLWIPIWLHLARIQNEK